MCVQSDRTCVSSLIRPQDAYARGEVFIGSKENSYTVLPSLPQNVQGHHWQHGITIVTPDRKFLFACETEEDQKGWMAAFQTVINRPMLPQEYAGKLGARLSRRLLFIPASDASYFPIFSAVEAYFKHKPWPWPVFEELSAANEQQGKGCRKRETWVFSDSL